MGMGSLNTGVLMIGVEPREFDHFQRMVKDALHSHDMGWSRIASPSLSFEQAFLLALLHCDLDVVYVANQVGRTEREMRRGVTLLAEALKSHPGRPWVALEDESLCYLEPILEEVGITVMTGLLLDIVLSLRHDRLAKGGSA